MPISALFIYFTMDPPRHFPYLLFQTRYGANCFASQSAKDERGSVL